jgi:peroxiredoxin
VDYAGDDVLLVLANTRCSQCASKIPLLNELHAEGLPVLFVAVGADPKNAQDYITEKNIAFDVLVDSYGIAASQYGVTRVPEVFILDKDGGITYCGPQEGLTVWQYLSSAPAEHAASATETHIRK